MNNVEPELVGAVATTVIEPTAMEVWPVMPAGSRTVIRGCDDAAPEGARKNER